MVLGMVACNEEQVQSKVSQSTNSAISVQNAGLEHWSEAIGKCISATTQWCDGGCKPCTPDPTGNNIFVAFKNALVQGAPSVQDFFSATNVAPLWPNFAPQVELINGLKNGQKRIITVTNPNSQVDYFLIGNTQLNDESIRANPDYAIYSEC